MTSKIKYGYICKEYISIQQIIKHNALKSYYCYYNNKNLYYINLFTSPVTNNFIKLDLDKLKQNEYLKIDYYEKKDYIIITLKKGKIIPDLSQYITETKLFEEQIDTKSEYYALLYIYILCIENCLFDFEITKWTKELSKFLSYEILTDETRWRFIYNNYYRWKGEIQNKQLLSKLPMYNKKLPYEEKIDLVFNKIKKYIIDWNL